MPAYNFKKQFADDIQSGKKRQTIRRPRKRPTKVGDILKLYTGMRTKYCRFLIQVICEQIIPVEIYPYNIKLDGKLLTHQEASIFAEKDGFNSIWDFYDFFDNQYGPSFDRPLKMEVIMW